ncbi:rhomboid family intramembrane serine protease [Oceanomicrobium pacificus]|uniref:Rhomboid family intramembrane serine protease n=1 Tax=Oceanomicrobium pacificus TaxID=2692916 RepID=A0A6B0TIK4_9RHOB|nr:rhomboid family intramembrane serine protease [Oceanomicrobium pacificus]MXU64197.1 rhomboid family intramembrane serine protease [Oceanomicrobium pacificus]
MNDAQQMRPGAAQILGSGRHGESRALRAYAPPVWRNAAVLLVLVMVLIQTFTSLGWPIGQGLGLFPPEWASAEVNVLHNWMVFEFGLTPYQAFGFVPVPDLGDHVWAQDCLRDGPRIFEGDLRDACYELRAALAEIDIPAEPWRLVTHALLHAGWFHLLMNSFAFILFVPMVLRRMGSARFLFFFAGAAAAGGLAHIGLRYGIDGVLVGLGVRAAPDTGIARTALVGMSGVVFALWAVCLRIQFDRIRRQPVAERAITPARYLGRVFINLAVINLVFILFQSFISGEAHIGGALFGFLFGPLFFTTGASLAARSHRMRDITWLRQPKLWPRGFAGSLPLPPLRTAERRAEGWQRQA